MIERPAMPIRIDPATGRWAVLEQDSDEDIAQCIHAIVDSRPGDRADLPALGVIDDTFSEQPLDTDTLVEIVEKFEPRAAILASTNPEAMNQLVADINLQWRRSDDGTDTDTTTPV